jgi:transposase-like protein
MPFIDVTEIVRTEEAEKLAQLRKDDNCEEQAECVELKFECKIKRDELASPLKPTSFTDLQPPLSSL